MCQSSQTYACGVALSGIVYLYGFLIHQRLLYVLHKVLPQNVVVYAAQVLDVVNVAV